MRRTSTIHEQGAAGATPWAAQAEDSDPKLRAAGSLGVEAGEHHSILLFGGVILCPELARIADPSWSDEHDVSMDMLPNHYVPGYSGSADLSSS